MLCLTWVPLWLDIQVSKKLQMTKVFWITFTDFHVHTEIKFSKFVLYSNPNLSATNVYHWKNWEKTIMTHSPAPKRSCFYNWDLFQTEKHKHISKFIFSHLKQIKYAGSDYLIQNKICIDQINMWKMINQEL